MKIRIMACVMAMAAVGYAVPAAAALPVLLPDAQRYADADVSARGLPEAPYGQRASTGLFPQVPTVRKLTDEGWLAASHARTRSAQINFDRALRIAPNDRRLLWAYGWGLLNLGQPEAALQAFQRNLALRPGQRPQWVPMAMALTYTAAGQREAAVAWYRAAQASDPLRFGSDGATLRSTRYWTSRERALVDTLLEAAARDEGGMAPANVAAR